MTEQKLLERLSGLPQEREPVADLWPGIQRQLESVSHPTRSAGSKGISAVKVWAMAAAVAVAIFSGSVGYVVGRAGVSPERPLVLQALPATETALLYAQNLEQEFLGAWRELNSAQMLPAGFLSGEARDEFKHNMNLLELATDEIKAALSRDPDSMYLAYLLETTYQQRISFMRSVMLQTGAAPTATDIQNDRSML